MHIAENVGTGRDDIIDCPPDKLPGYASKSKGSDCAPLTVNEESLDAADTRWPLKTWPGATWQPPGISAVATEDPELASEKGGPSTQGGKTGAMTAYKYQVLRPERSLEATVICPEQLQVDGGRVLLDAAVRGRFMQLLRLELSLGPMPQQVQLALEEGTLPIQRFTLPLPDDARVLGFRYWEVGGSGSCIAKDGAEAAACGAEATDPTTGFADLRDIHILLDVKGHLQLEPLSRRYLRCESIEFPGRLRWMPPALERLEKEGEDIDISMLPEVIGLRSIQGSVDHIVECKYAQSWTCTLDAVRSLTGQSAMFWAELFLLTLVPSSA
ncbi:hypothetical protein AK812_SmicGene31834 [Symbiodinium microadriaticum]|uniref:Uncharacterized protein n=1 Tax=Symbiodinium microadriaticum TaxID=2951 RepID=A0A1Q9CVQ6_SYMMI|nr:hypothetical protein AK812_SmicGene31834 [Symbiodinium microadriaticum]